MKALLIIIGCLLIAAVFSGIEKMKDFKKRKESNTLLDYYKELED